MPPVPLAGLLTAVPLRAVRWYVWVDGTEGNLLSDGAALMQFTLDRSGGT